MPGDGAYTGVCVDGLSACAVSVAAGQVESVADAEAGTPAEAVATVLRRTRATGNVSVVRVSSPCAAVAVPMTPDMVSRHRFEDVAARLLAGEADAGRLHLPDEAVLAGVLARPEVVRSGRMSTALAVAAAGLGAAAGRSWLAAAPSASRLSVMAPPVVAAQAPPGVTVWMFSAAVVASARLGDQPLGWRVLPGAGMSAAVSRIGADGRERMVTAWAGGRGDPVAEFEVRRAAAAAADCASGLRSTLLASGFAVSATVNVMGVQAPPPALEASLADRGLGCSPGGAQPPAATAASAAAVAAARFGSSVVVERFVR